ncbi:ABC transporter permease [Muricauda sp. CAU 1633]|uniref:ABC transporter permease n=1 Tax=Allomuricauda sp. CAU 1633 TaxID=2816036 RepID=UPI001A8DAE12|nr:ABC transporter permease [Muricauda sp. CAU 1633]MBO0321070.1 ABC transporter permease [Muricauda sp. CAU 1633]
MLKHNVLLFFRSIKKNKSTFLINVLGLGLGIASFLILFLYIYNDITYNHFHKNLDRIYRVREGETVQTRGLLLPEMLKDIPEIEDGTRIFDWDGARLSYGDLAFYENIKYADEGFFDIFTFSFVEGSPKKILEDKYGVVISTEFAKKYFGDVPALGKQLDVNFGNQFLTVKGVVDIPYNSSIKFDILSNYVTGEEILPWIKDAHNWQNVFSITYVLLEDGVKPHDFKDKIQKIVKRDFFPTGESNVELNLLPFKDYHSVLESNQTLMVILFIIALGIIGIAIVNFINLTITQSFSRVKEVGVKKVHGASKTHLLRQIMTESFLMSLMALIVGGFLLVIFLPSFNTLLGINLKFNLFKNSSLLLTIIGLWCIVGLLSGLLPLSLWMRGKLTNTLKGNMSNIGKPNYWNYTLVVVQFIIAIFLISGTLLIRKQVTDMLEKNPGFDSENVIVVELDGWQFSNLEKASDNIKRISEELQASSYVSSISFSTTAPGNYQQNYNVFFSREESNVESIHLRKAYVGYNYFKTMGIDLLNGSGFPRDSILYKNTVVLNQKAMGLLGYQGASNQILHEGSPDGTPYKVIGTITDFSYQSIDNQQQPLAHFFIDRENFTDWPYLMIKSTKGTSLDVVEIFKEKWSAAFPGIEPNLFFADEKLNNQYKKYIETNTLVTWFSILAIMLSCMGLFALSTYSLARRTKEIGIRKVNGATITQVLALLNKDFLKWVALGFVIAVPISWYAMEQWLTNFAYKTNISWWIFILAGGLTLMIAFLTVSWQSYWAASVNPVKSLRTE